MDYAKYVNLEGSWHPIADDEHTDCGLVVPPITHWEKAVPEGEPVHCGPTATEDKPKAKKK